MATPIDQLLSRTIYLTDGTTTVWDFSFSGGYLDVSHVKAYTETPAGIRTAVTGTLIGAYQLQITPVLTSGDTLVIYRDTPKNLPLVDFTDESGFSEVALDTNAKQAVFIAAEGADLLALTDLQAAFTAAEAAGLSADSATASKLAAEASAVAAAASRAAADLDAAATAADRVAVTANYNNAVAIYDGIVAVNAAVTSASGSATSAAGSATAASNSATAASGSATASANSATASSNSATAASGSATAASGSAVAAAASESAAAGSASAASGSASAAAASYDAFDDRWLGPKAVAPTLDNDGNALLTGALYWDTVLPGMRAWTGTAWSTLPAATAAATANTPAGSIAAVTVQAAINELDAEKAALAGSSAQPFNASTLTLSGALTTASLKEDAAGNLGIGVVPSAWGAPAKALQIGSGALWNYNGSPNMYIGANYYFDGAARRYITSGFAVEYLANADGTHTWYTAPSGTAGNPITFAQVMALDASGNLLVGVASGACHSLAKEVALGVPAVAIGGTGGANAVAVYTVDGQAFGAANAANAAMKVGSCTTGRSINAHGTINASGADYAEYERNNGLTIAKGDIVGFKADGTLTNVYSEAIRFAIKSTNPSYVGGDTWGSEDQVGKRPEQPAEGEDQTQYLADLAVFEDTLEAARQLVDRIAYSGKVPCNVLGATPGGYIIAVDNAGAIAGEFVVDPDFAQYRKTVGRVNRILEDGRCEVAVIIH